MHTEKLTFIKHVESVGIRKFGPYGGEPADAISVGPDFQSIADTVPFIMGREITSATVLVNEVETEARVVYNLDGTAPDYVNYVNFVPDMSSGLTRYRYCTAVYAKGVGLIQMRIRIDEASYTWDYVLKKKDGRDIRLAKTPIRLVDTDWQPIPTALAPSRKAGSRFLPGILDGLDLDLLGRSKRPGTHYNTESSKPAFPIPSGKVSWGPR